MQRHLDLEPASKVTAKKNKNKPVGCQLKSSITEGGIILIIVKCGK